MSKYYTLSGRIIKIIRLLNNMTTEEISEKIGVSKQHFQNVESGTQKLGRDSTRKFLNVVGLSKENIEMLKRHLT